MLPGKTVRGEIYVVTGHGEGHLQPCIELCKLLSLRNYLSTLVIPSTLASSIPPSFTGNPLTAIAQISPSAPIPILLGNNQDPLAQRAAEDLEVHVSRHKPVCAIVDFQMGWTKRVFRDSGVPVVSLFTFGACAAAMEWGAWKVKAGELASPGESRAIPGLPAEMAVTYTDLKRKPHRGPPGPGNRPLWVGAIEGCDALLFNTCLDLDGAFLEYLESEIGVPAWAVGPLFPDPSWRLLKESDVADEELIRWLDSRPPRSVLYVAFGSTGVGPTEEELPNLAAALGSTNNNWGFVWVLQSGFSCGYDLPGREKGVVIRGWAPQGRILGHVATGGFLTHCGWNSTMEALENGVPMLTWPVRGDQHWNAKLVADHLKVGWKVADDMSRVVGKEEIVKGIERVMGDDEMRTRAEAFKDEFGSRFPPSSDDALDAFARFVDQKCEPGSRLG